MTEETRFKRKVQKYLDKIGAFNVKFFANMYTQSGIPDILICYNGRFVALELKAENGILSEIQDYRIRKIRESGGIAEIIYPKDFEKLKKIMEGIK